MDKIGVVSQFTFNLFGHSITINPTTFVMTWIVMGLLVILGIYSTRRLHKVPGVVQNMAEMVYTFIEDLTVNTLGEKDGRRFLPFIFSIFVFTLLGNWIGIFPNIFHLIGMFFAGIHNIFGGDTVEFVYGGLTKMTFAVEPSTWYSFLLKIPDLEEPTRSVNTDLALALMVFFVVHINAIIKNGFLGYLKGYWGDVMPCHGWWLLLAPINIMIPLNIIGEVSSVVSHSFRLFGNIFGGFMILTIVSSLVKFLVVPIGLLAFFGLFAGLVQAFVFTMLAITYIGQKA